jgi:predicted RNA-binding Zn-ribbon protein involved in translation (DUF1610 family)
MKCPNCGEDRFTFKATAITEYHDAKLTVRGLLDPTLDDMTLEIEGSYYIAGVRMECLECGAQIQPRSDDEATEVYNAIAGIADVWGSLIEV